MHWTLCIIFIHSYVTAFRVWIEVGLPFCRRSTHHERGLFDRPLPRNVSLGRQDGTWKHGCQIFEQLLTDTKVTPSSAAFKMG